jgi:hypothetical protein
MKESWPKGTTVLEFSLRLRKTTKSAVRIAGDSAEIRTDYLTNTSPERYFCANLFVEFKVFIETRVYIYFKYILFVFVRFVFDCCCKPFTEQ